MPIDKSLIDGLELTLYTTSDLTQIRISPDNVITFSLGNVNLEVIDRKGGTHVLENPVALGSFDIIVAEDAEYPLIRNRMQRRTYGKMKGVEEPLVWDHPHVLNMHPRSNTYITACKPLIEGHRWDQLMSITMIFLSSANLEVTDGLKIIKLWNQPPTEAELVGESDYEKCRTLITTK